MTYTDAMYPRRTCAVCHRIKATYCRGVCWSCYRKGHKPPVTSKFRPDLREEPSEAELEATIAEQMETMPSWNGRDE